MSVFLQAALSYARRGWYVFPCQPHSKVPATAHGFKDATRDEVQISEWWAEDPGYNVAIATGEVSGIFVLDVDEKPGRSIEEALAVFPKLPDVLPTVRTGGGGLQYFFQYPAGSNLSISGGRLGVGIDTRGNGGYVVAPPSIHDKTGMGYHWIDCDDATPLPETPTWIIEKLHRQESAAKQFSAVKITGGRHEALKAYAAMMRNIGAETQEILAALKLFRHRLDTSDGRVIDDDECRRMAYWMGERGMADANVQSAVEGSEIFAAFRKTAGSAVQEAFGESVITDPGHFPADLLTAPGIVSQWVDFILRTSYRKQPELALAAALTASGALIGRRLETEQRGRANMYCLGLCETGGGKERARQGVREVLVAAGADDILGPEDFASETGLVSSLVVSPVQLFQIDEIGKLLASISNPRSGTHLVGIVSALLKLYSSAGTVYKGKAYADAAKNPVIDQPHACVYGTAVPDQTWEALGASAVDDGLLARLWVFVAAKNKPDKQKPERMSAPPDLVAAIRAWSQTAPAGLASISPTPAVVPRTKEAEKIFDELEATADTLEARLGDNPLRRLWTRTAQKADQLALVYAWSVNPQTPVIDQAAAAWSCKLAEYLTNVMIWHANRHLAGSATEVDLKAVLRYIEATKHGRTRSEIVRRFQRLGVRLMSDIMTMLVDSGQIEAQTTTAEGAKKPATVYQSTSKGKP